MEFSGDSFRRIEEADLHLAAVCNIRRHIRTDIAHMDAERSGLYAANHLLIQHRELIWGEFKLDPPGFTGLERDSLYPFELDDWGADRSYFIGHIKLRHLISVPGSGILYIGRHRDIARIAGLGRDAEVGITKFGVAQPEPETILRRERHVIVAVSPS